MESLPYCLLHTLQATPRQSALKPIVQSSLLSYIAVLQTMVPPLKESIGTYVGVVQALSFFLLPNLSQPRLAGSLVYMLGVVRGRRKSKGLLWEEQRFTPEREKNSCER